MANLHDYPGISNGLRLLADCRSGLALFLDVCAKSGAPQSLLQHLLDAVCDIRSAEVIVLESIGIKDSK